MALFDRFVTERSTTQRKGLRYTVSFSAFLHVIAGVVLVGWSFWKIEKLMPRSVPITFHPVADPPLPPPEPPKLPPVKDVVSTKQPSGPETNVYTKVVIVDTRPPGDKNTDHPNPPGVTGGDPTGIGPVPPLPPPEIVPPPLPPPTPPGLSDAERRALILGYLHDTVQPQVLRHFAYPSDAQRNGIEGAVIVRLTIDATGQLVHSKVVSGPEPTLCQAALASAAEAAPFPRPPEGLGNVTVDVHFEYHLD